MDADSDRTGWRELDVEGRGATLAAQTLGDEGDPAVLLIGAATWSRDWWNEGFCAALAAEGLRVIRYDARDTGASTASPPGEADYDAADLVGDAIAVLDAAGVRRATIVGISMGGGVAQRLAVEHPDRVAALVLESTSPAGDVGAELPPPSDEILATFTAEAPEPDWTDRDAVIAWVVASERPYAGPEAFDETALGSLVGRVFDRTPSMAAAATNHFLVAEAAPSVDLAALRGTRALVVHGSVDPLFPLAHGEALAGALDAPLLVLDGVGHQAPPPSAWPELVAAIARLARGDAPLDTPSPQPHQA